jgi:hypothetical protein
MRNWTLARRAVISGDYNRVSWERLAQSPNNRLAPANHLPVDSRLDATATGYETQIRQKLQRCVDFPALLTVGVGAWRNDANDAARRHSSYGSQTRTQFGR